MQVMGTAPKSSGGPVNALDRRAKRWQYETFQYLEPIRRSCLYPGPDILYSFDRALMSVKADVYFSSVTRETGVGIQGSNASKATVAGQANLAGNKIRSSTHSSPSALGQNIKLSVQALASLSVDEGDGVCQLAGYCKPTPWLEEGIDRFSGRPRTLLFPRRTLQEYCQIEDTWLWANMQPLHPKSTCVSLS